MFLSSSTKAILDMAWDPSFCSVAHFFHHNPGFIHWNQLVTANQASKST